MIFRMLLQSGEEFGRLVGHIELWHVALGALAIVGAWFLLHRWV